MRKKSKFVVGFLLLILLASFSPIVFTVRTAEPHSERGTLSSVDGSDSFTPVMWKAAGVDKDNNGIADSFDREITDRIANGRGQDYVNVTVMLKSAPTIYNTDAFTSSGGHVTAGPWAMAIYGFGGMIPYGNLVSFVQRCSDVLLIEKEGIVYSDVAYAARQVGARPYVWNTVGLQGDPNSSIAIVDSGIDASHTDFSPGFGNADFSKKIVGWYDNVSGTTTPFDDNGHGSYCAGLAAGNGFFSTDASGNAITTWGEDLGNGSGTSAFGMMVNKAGTITIQGKWATGGTNSLSTVYLYNGHKTLDTNGWTQLANVSTPSEDTWYTLTYNVTSTPAGGYDMYHVLMSVASGTDNHLYAAFTVSWPYTPPSDGSSAWTGIAPQAKLVGVKVMTIYGNGTTNSLFNGINWIISNRRTYHITIASMSLSLNGENNTIDNAVVNLVNSGVTTVVAAGNSGPGSNYIYTPGSVDEVMTVAAMNQFDNIAIYSGQGGTSRYQGNTMKPDITAPGGSIYAMPIFSADSNYNDAQGRWSDVQANDSALMQGTSMATPIVAGAADLVIQAMGGYANWQYTRSQALQPKMILLMTTTETNPNLREGDDGTHSPTLDRGGKDVHEGYGRLNVDAAVDAVSSTYQVGTTATGTLGKAPTLDDISVLGQRLAWARNVQIFSGYQYNFSLSVPAGADYDLYLYNSTGTTYGEPAIVAKSTTAATGGTEAFSVTAPYTGTYYTVVKRATETTGGGNFTLTSTGPLCSNLTIDSSTGGTTDPPAGTYTYPEGTLVNVTAIPSGDYGFDHWSMEGFNYTSNPLHLAWDGTSNHELTPHFVFVGGGCPYVYAWNGTGYAKDNNILPATETGNGTDTKDYYLLQQPLVPSLRSRQTSLYSLQIREFESEIDYIDQVKLIAVDHSPGTSVAVTPEGEILTYTSPTAPISCIDNNGVSRLSEIGRMDGNVSDPSTYFQGNKDDWLVLDFGNVTGPAANLILRDDMLCDKERCINVQVQDANGVWQTVEALLHPRAFWSIEAVNMTACVPETGDFQVRLLWTASHRLDYVGLDTSSPGQVKIASASPILAVHSTLGNVRAELLYDDEHCVKLVSGQQITMAFMLPNNLQDTTRDFILYTDGYYYTITP